MRTYIYGLIRRRPVYAGVFLIFFAYLAAFLTIEQRGLFGDDPANKLLLIKTLKNNQYSDVVIEPPGKKLDPGFKFNPLAEPFYVLQSDDKLYSVYPPFFSLLSSPFYFAFGVKGLYVLPLLSTLILLAGVGSILQDASRAARTTTKKGKARRGEATNKEISQSQWLLPFIGIIVAGLFTPLLFYSQVFWEHASAGALLVWSIKFVTDYLYKNEIFTLIVATILASLSVYLRDSLYVFLVAALVSLVLFSAGQRVKVAIVYILTAILSLIPLWVFQWYVTGSIFGYHISSHVDLSTGLLGHFVDRAGVIYNLLLSAFGGALTSVALILPFVLLLLSSPLLAISDKKFTSTISFIAIISLLIASIGFINLLNADVAPLYILDNVNSLLLAAPILFLATIRPGVSGKQSLLKLNGLNFTRTLLVLYLLAYVAVAPLLGTKGIHWGTRFLYVAYPLLAILVAENVCLLMGAGVYKGKVKRLKRFGATAIVMLAVLSFSMQLWSLDFLNRKKQFSFELNDVLQGRDEQVIVSDVWWALQELPQLYYDKLLFHVKNNQDYMWLTEKLKSREYKDILLLVDQKVGRNQPGAIDVDDNGLGLFSLTIIPVKL